jgi:hypothetical protein
MRFGDNQERGYNQEAGITEKGVIGTEEWVTYSVSIDNLINQVPVQQDSSLGHSKNQPYVQYLISSPLSSLLLC